MNEPAAAPVNSRFRERWDRIEPYAAVIARLVLAAVFLVAAWHKLKDPISFMLKVQEYEVPPPSWIEALGYNPDRWIEPFAYILPWFEIAAAAMLVSGLLTRVGGGLTGGMLLMFIAAVAVNLYRERVMGCGCFSEEGNQIGPFLLIQDLALAGLSVYLVWRGGGRFSLDNLLARLWKRGQKVAPPAA